MTRNTDGTQEMISIEANELAAALATDGGNP